MKTFASALLLLFPAVVAAQPKDPAAPLAITGVTIIDGTGAAPQADMTVLITGDRITEIGKTGRVTIPEGAKQIKADGKFMIPGLWDMHVHLEKEFLPQFVANGVTGVRHMFSRQGVPGFPSPPAHDWQKEIESGRMVGPRIVATMRMLDGLNGTAPVIPGSAIPIRTPDEGRAAVAKMRTDGEDFIKVYPFLKPDAYFAILEEAARGPRKLAVSGHVPHAVRAADASDRGQKSMEHLYGVVLGCSKQEDQLRKELIGLMESGAMVKDTLDAAAAWRIQVKALDSYDEPTADALFKKFVKNGTWQVPTLVTRRVWASLNDPKFTDDPRKKTLPPRMRFAWMATNAQEAIKVRVFGAEVAVKVKEKKFPILGIWLSDNDIEQQKLLFEGHLRLVKAMHKAGVPMLTGTDTPVPFCFPGSGVHDELELLVQAGLTPAEALRAATRNPAEYLDKLKDLGTVERGKLADLVLLDANPLDDIKNIRKVHAVVLNGRLLPKATLEKLADGKQP
ncbi:MAG: amidohydrolase family protein [Planctomycetes bacterium]|nr:amidohydrolase family protein [Planctomycetota bacterium]